MLHSSNYSQVTPTVDSLVLLATPPSLGLDHDLESVHWERMPLEVVVQTGVIAVQIGVVVDQKVAVDQMEVDVSILEVARMHPEGIIVEERQNTVGKTHVLMTMGHILWNHSSR